MTRRIDIDGQDFDVVEEFTLEQELYLAGLIRRARLDRLPIHRSDALSKVTDVLMDALVECRFGRQIISAVIVPAGELWTLDEASRTAAYLREHLPLIDDQAVDTLAVVLLQALFDRGAVTASAEAQPPEREGSR